MSADDRAKALVVNVIATMPLAGNMALRMETAREVQALIVATLQAVVLDEQSKADERLAALTAENDRLLTVLREVSEYLDGSNYATDSGDLPDTVRAALASGEPR